MTEQLIKIELIDDNPYQDRGAYEDIEGLGRTIASSGLKQFPKARKVGDRFQLEFGHRRKRAFYWLCDNWEAEGLPDRYNGYSVMPLQVEAITDDQMFDGVVIENVHRDDLKVTEKARLLRRYKEMHPEARSEQIGLVFNMNAATVRGMDIFLDLPEPVQSKLDDGTITQGTARLLHSMQKIAPEAKILETLKKVEKEKGNSLPDDVIENAIDHLDNTECLWNEHNRDGKPRAGYHGWPLDMKNFPNKLLEHIAPGDMVSLGLINVSELTKEHTNYSLGLPANLPDELKARLDHLFNPPACSACPFYTKIQGSHYCGVKFCYQRKAVAWGDYTVEMASKNTKIAIYAESNGPYRALDYQDGKLFEKKDKDLRLVPKRMIKGYAYQSYKGLDDDLVVVVATGKALEKMSRSSSSTRGGKKTEKEKTEMRAMKIYRVKRKELLWAFTAYAKSMFDVVPLAVLERVNTWRFLGVDNQPPVEEPARKDINAFGEHKRRLLVWRMIEDCSSHYRRETLTDILGKLADFAREWKVKVPASLPKLAEAMDAEIKSVVSGETGGKK